MKIVIQILCIVLCFSTASATTYYCETDGGDVCPTTNTGDGTCSPTVMTSCISEASNGDTIIIPSGTHNWTGVSTTGVVIDKPLTIDGQGSCTNCGESSPSGSWPAVIENTYASALGCPTDSNAKTFFQFKVTDGSTGTIHINGIHFKGKTCRRTYYCDDSTGGHILEHPLNGCGDQNDDGTCEGVGTIQYRISHNKFQNTNTVVDGYNATDIHIQSSRTFGVIDNNYFAFDGYQGVGVEVARNRAVTTALNTINDEQAHGDGSCIGSSGDPPAHHCGGAWAWYSGGELNWGGSDFVFVEDNTFKFDLENDECSGSGGQDYSVALDCAEGGKVVFRYNYVEKAFIGGHDLTASSYTIPCRAFEVYNNTLDWITCRGVTNYIGAFNARFGSQLIYSNDIGTSNFQYLVNDFYQRGTWPACDNANDFDGDSSDPDGYRCLCQPGTGQTAGLYTSDMQPIEAAPYYIWSNTGTPINGNIRGGFPNYFESGTDYYFSTDDSAALGGYSAYTYPHPLTGASSTTTTTATMEGVSITGISIE